MPRMKMKITLEQKGAEKTHDVIADGRDIRKYEAEFEQSYLTHTDYSQLSQIAYVAMRRQGTFVGSWELFDGQCVDLQEMGADDPESEPEDPTRTERGDDS